ncbi:hypothetical protein [Nocardia cyriacigeorgica]|uniref:Secreted protein n=1 Tax=Nocardia cyriacigeorgica TaxID=135487 RepID=A0A4U8VWV2_9NOCA|nr:hypothetical protein [Nocardia cyriacigeorgica]MBF6101481.1 hypothetical protein [Nocardia cyriacigeorgica]MBF6162122.1 hypothetical protein [Nocardia cyriacigeorgica]MBF6200816.1 hypothetical protein [Nocardia cyriacigeorgica]VFA97125.1 Uncharacterised protein [Nocardia cyriacigeorgica]
MSTTPHANHPGHHAEATAPATHGDHGAHAGHATTATIAAAHGAHAANAGHGTHQAHTATGAAASGDHAAHGATAPHGDHAGHGTHAAHTATDPATTGDHAGHGATAAHGGHAGHTDHAAHAGHGAAEFPGGLLITQDGYTLQLADTILRPGDVDFRFRIIGPDGRPVTEYSPIHDKELHLIVVPRELTGFWHVHPERAADGTWSVRLNLPEAGAYRVFTDISPLALGKTITLGADLAVAGAYAPQPVPESARTFGVDGYEVELTGDLTTGAGSLLTLTVRKDGVAVTDLQPYLAAFGHLVIIRAGDLAYVHVHPNGEPGDGITAPGPDVSFHTAVPGPGTYRLFLDFKHGDTVRTAAFTLSTPAVHH